MNEQIILDSDFKSQNSEIELKKKNKKYLIIICGFIVINTILFGILIKGFRSSNDTFIAALNANLIGYNILGFIIGAIIALFPYKNFGYRKKYLRASLLVILTIHIIMFIGLILIGIMSLLGFYK